MSTGSADDDVIPPVFDIEAALAPIGGDDPAGVDLSEGDSIEISELRSGVRSEETATTKAQGAPRKERPPDTSFVAQWRALSERAIELLGRTKDIRVALMLVQSLTRAHGVVGLRDGLTLLNRLSETFGDGMHPRNAEERRRMVGQYFGQDRPGLLRACEHAELLSGEVKIGQDGDNPGGTVACAVTPQALREARDSEYLRQTRRSGLLVPSKDELAAMIRSPHAAAGVAAARRALDQVDEQLGILRERCSASGAELHTPKISECILSLRSFLDEVLPRTVDSPAASDSSGSGASLERPGTAAVEMDTGGAVARAGPPGNRGEAIATILRLAAWFESREPQGTVHHDLRRAARRATLPLEKVLEELASESGEPVKATLRRQLLWNLGVDPEKIDPPKPAQDS